jgi:hypothetical protein
VSSFSKTGLGNLRHRKVSLRPAGADGSAVATAVLKTGPAVIRFLAIDYLNQPATTDIVISSAVAGAAGDALFTVTSANTDITLKPVTLTAGVDEAGAAIAATDGTAGGFPVEDGLYIDVAQADGQTTGDEEIVIDVLYEEVEKVVLELYTVGADGAAVATRLFKLPGNRPGVVRAIKVDYQNEPVTTDITIKRDVAGDLTGGTTIFTRASSATDIALSPVGMPALNESNAATAATDATDGGWPFLSNLYVEVAEADGQTGGDEKILITLYIDG